MMDAAIYLLLLITPAFCASVRYRECSTKGSMADINKVEMTPYTNASCPLSAVKSLAVNITFIPLINLKNPVVMGIIARDRPLGRFRKQPACDDLVNLKTGNKLQSENCSLKANNMYQFTANKFDISTVIKLNILSQAENSHTTLELKGQYKMIWIMLYPKSDKLMFCASVAVEVAKNKTM